MNDWNEKIEKTLVNLGCKCGAYRIMHDESSEYCNQIDSYMTFASITLSTLTATGLFSLEESATVKIASGVAIYFIAFLTSMKQFLNYTELVENHKTYSMRFSAIYRDIQRQLCLNKNDRRNGKEYLTFVNNELDNLLFSNPSIPTRIKKRNLGDYKQNSAYESSMCKDIYDIIIDVDIPGKSENEVDISEIEVQRPNLHSNYQLDRFLHNF